MFRKFFKDYFSFTKSEKNGILILLALIILVIILRVAIPHFRKNRIQDFSEFQEEINEFEKSLADSHPVLSEKHLQGSGSRLFFFDPNTVSEADLEKLGLNPFVIQNILKYREHGGKFKNKTDLMKIYGLDTAVFKRIESYIQIVESEEMIMKEESPPEKESAESSPIPLNLSDSADLVKIKGLGPVLSGRIVKYRNLLGGYVRKEQLLEVYGLTAQRFNEIKEAVYIDTVNIIPIFLNKIDAQSLAGHPYLNTYQLRALIRYREMNGKFERIDEITENQLLPGETFEKIKPYLKIE
ncbi:MAG: hypothetical protein AMS27_05335 [Bacteroides sp. SM23_62_1]|nr:MAG: hypothetical protein AMS27_05335 [Bacteroides sp. SM23_62_1]